MRDRKMHKEVLESERYPEIAFRPDKIEGAVASQGKSSVKVHGMFNIHGVEDITQSELDRRLRGIQLEGSTLSRRGNDRCG